MSKICEIAKRYNFLLKKTLCLQSLIAEVSLLIPSYSSITRGISYKRSECLDKNYSFQGLKFPTNLLNLPEEKRLGSSHDSQGFLRVMTINQRRMIQTQKPAGVEKGPHTYLSHPMLRMNLEQTEIFYPGYTSKDVKWLFPGNFQESRGVKITNIFQDSCSSLQQGCTEFP